MLRSYIQKTKNEKMKFIIFAGDFLNCALNFRIKVHFANNIHQNKDRLTVKKVVNKIKTYNIHNNTLNHMKPAESRYLA
jgi:hypothetical protein